MSTSNYIEEYLLKLGATVDQSGMQKFFQALHGATTVSETSAKAIAGAFFKAQTEIVAGFAALGTATVGLIEKVAMADQQYRLFALHMYMSKDAARNLKVAMDALGEPLENLTWDRELRERTRQLIEDQRAMAPDGDFDAQMKKVRDIRFEFTRMEVEGQYLAMHVVNDFMRALGFGPNELLNKLRQFNDWVTHNLPEISNKIVTLFLPVWKDMELVFSATGKALAATSVAFTNFIGLITGDHSIMGTKFDLEKLAGAVVHVANGFAIFASAIANVEELLAHLVSAIALVASGDFSGAGTELKAAFHSITAGAVGGVMGGAAAGMLAGGAAGSIAGPVGTLVGGAGGAVMGAFVGSNIGDKLVGGGAVYGPSTRSDNAPIAELIDRYSRGFGISPALAHALAMTESGERQEATSKTGARGVMQLTQGTARGLHVNREDVVENISGGMALLSHLLNTYHDVPTAIAAYHEGEPKMDAILAGKATLSSEAYSEVAKVMQRLGTHGDVHIGSIVVHVDKTNATNEDVARVVVDRIRSTQTKTIQRNLSEFQDPAWSY